MTKKKNILTGADIFFEALREEGVEKVFGYPGGATIKIYEKLYDIDFLEHILTRHEQGATHAADGYARVTGKVGVVLVTSGPGATNTVTGIANAYMDSIPIVVFTGQVPSNLIGNDAFQEADIVGITRPITKHNFLVRDVKDLASTIKKAFYIASTGRPGRRTASASGSPASVTTCTSRRKATRRSLRRSRRNSPGPACSRVAESGGLSVPGQPW